MKVISGGQTSVGTPEWAVEPGATNERTDDEDQGRH